VQTEAPTGETEAPLNEVQYYRRRLAVLCQGLGMEVGPLHARTQGIHKDSTVLYTDRETREQLVARYKNDEGVPEDLIAPTDIVADGAYLPLRDGALDFVIANHVIEHLPDPVAAITSWRRVLKPGGRLYLTIPDKRYCFDESRELTSWAHLKRDFERSDNGLTDDSRQHAREWARIVEGVAEREVDKRVDEIHTEQPNYHFHTWTYESMIETLSHAGGELGLWFRCDDYLSSYETWGEIILLLTKTEGAHDLLAESYKLPEWYIAAMDEALPELEQGTVLEQSFSCARPGLTAIHVRIGTYGRPNTGRLLFRLYEGDADAPLVEQTVDVSEISNNWFHIFEFPPIQQSEGQRFRLQLEAPESSPGNAVTVWCARYEGGLQLKRNEEVLKGLTFNLKAFTLGRIHEGEVREIPKMGLWGRARRRIRTFLDSRKNGKGTAA